MLRLIRLLLVVMGTMLLCAAGALHFGRQPAPRSAARVVISRTAEGFHLFYRWRDTRDYKQLTRQPCVLFCGSLTWSPDGRWIAYLDNAGIAAVRFDGLQQRRLLEGEVAGLAWSPDGSQIIYEELQGSTFGIYLISLHEDTLETQPLLPKPYSGAYPIWSLEGDWIIFVCGLPNGSQDICRIHADGSGLENLTQTPHIYEIAPQWSPDGKWLYVRDLASANLIRMRPDGSDYEMISSDRGLQVLDPTYAPPIDLGWQEQLQWGVGVIMVIGGIILWWRQA